MQADELYAKIVKLSKELGFSDLGCAKPSQLTLEEARYNKRQEKGYFGAMKYLRRNVEKRFDPSLLLPGCKSVIVFLAPFAKRVGGRTIKGGGNSERGGRISEYAQGVDYHVVIKKKLRTIATAIIEAGHKADANNSSKPCEIVCCRVFTDSAPILERAWAVRAGLGFIGKNNFLISPTCGIKNFIGIILTTAYLPYNEKVIEPSCGSCEKCLEACSQKALEAPYTLNATKCLSYKSIEAPLETLTEPYANPHRWIFGCDDCTNACPYNSKNRPGWREFHSNEVLNNFTKAPSDFFQKLDPQEFERLFGNTPLKRAGLEKLRFNEHNA